VWYPKGLQQPHKFLYWWDSYRAHLFLEFTKNDNLVFSDGIPYCTSLAMGKLTP
jgi:hypothetical protein